MPRALGYTPAANYSGSDSFSFTVHDGAIDSPPATVLITVNPVNDRPVAEDDSHAVVPGGTLEVFAPGVIANDSDADGDPLTAILATGPSHGTLEFAADGSFRYAPDPTFVGGDQFTYRVVDPALLESNLATVKISVRGSLGGRLHVVDSSVEKAFEYALGGTAGASFDLASRNGSPRGVAAAMTGDTLWVVDSNERIFAYGLDSSPLRSWKALGLDRPEGIATDGVGVWVVDRDDERVYFFADGAARDSDARPTSSFPLAAGNGRPRGIAYGEIGGESYLWVVDSASSGDTVFRYTVGGSFSGSWTIDTENSDPRGIAVDSSNLSDIWIVDAGSDKVYGYGGAVTRATGSQSADTVFGLAVNNPRPQGIASRNDRTVAARRLVVRPPWAHLPSVPSSQASQAGRANPSAGPLASSREEPAADSLWSLATGVGELVGRHAVRATRKVPDVDMALRDYGGESPLDDELLSELVESPPRLSR